MFWRGSGVTGATAELHNDGVTLLPSPRANRAILNLELWNTAELA
jgi:hypothetical protein